MRGFLLGSGLLLIVGSGVAQAESGSFFKNIFGGGSGGRDAPITIAPRAFDPNDAYCPPVNIADGAAAIQAYAGGAGDGSRLRHQLTFGRISRECTAREGGALSVKVGVEVRVLLGPAGASGTFDAPLTVSIKYNGAVLATRSRRVTVTVPAGAAQGTAAVIEPDFAVPADKAIGYDIEVALGGQAARAKAPAKTAGKRSKPAADEAAVTEAPAAGQ